MYKRSLELTVILESKTTIQKNRKLVLHGKDSRTKLNSSQSIVKMRPFAYQLMVKTITD